MKKLAAILAVVGLGLAGFAGTCNLLQTSLTQIGSTDTYAGALQNNTGANFLGHAFKVTFVDAYGNIIDQRTNVSGCLRSWQNGTSDFFSVASTQPAASTVSAIASLDYSQPLVAGSTLATSSTVTGVTASLNGTTLTVAGTLRNNDAVTMVSPDVCAVVYNSSGNIVVTQMSTLGSLNPSTSINFTMSITVPGGTVSSNTVTVWADGLENNVPTTPIQSASTVVSSGGYKLAFATQPPASIGTSTAFAPVVVVQDVNSNTVTTSNAPVTLALSGGTPGAVLSCTSNPVYAVNGFANFSCNVNTAGNGYTLTATSTGLTGAVSTAFNVGAPGVVAKMGITIQPPSSVVSVTSFGLTAAVQDSLGSTVTTGAGSADFVKLFIQSGPANATLGGCTTELMAGLGVATFTGCWLDKVGTYTLLARDMTRFIPDGLTTPITVTVGAASQLAFVAQPAGGTHAVAFSPQPQVAVEDAGGNTITTDNTTTVTLAWTGTGTLSCTNPTVTVVNGVATFANCMISAAGTGTLSATSNPPLGTVTGTSGITIS